MVGNNPRSDQFFRTLKNTGGKATSSPGTSSGGPPIRYQNNEQAERVYRAQFALLKDLDRAKISGTRFAPRDLPIEQSFATRQEVQDYCDAVLANEWAHWRAGPPWPVRVQETNLLTMTYASGVIGIPHTRPLAWRQVFILHELTHHFTAPNDHSLQFVRTMLELLQHQLGDAVSDRFREYLTMNGVPT